MTKIVLRTSYKPRIIFVLLLASIGVDIKPGIVRSHAHEVVRVSVDPRLFGIGAVLFATAGLKPLPMLRPAFASQSLVSS